LLFYSNVYVGLFGWNYITEVQASIILGERSFSGRSLFVHICSLPDVFDRDRGSGLVAEINQQLANQVLFFLLYEVLHYPSDVYIDWYQIYKVRDSW
jgi:hypothetical protein